MDQYVVLFRDGTKETFKCNRVEVELGCFFFIKEVHYGDPKTLYSIPLDIVKYVKLLNEDL